MSPKIYLWLLMMCVCPAIADDRAGVDIGLEIQVYPTGVIPGLRAERALNAHHALQARVGYQRIRHEDFGVLDDERGDGAGFSIGYRYYKQTSHAGWSFSARTDLWFNRLDWTDNPGAANEQTGTTRVTVLQPTVGVGYTLLHGDFALTPTLSFGREINIDTDGAEVGQGAIWLVGLEWGVRF